MIFDYFFRDFFYFVTWKKNNLQIKNSITDIILKVQGKEISLKKGFQEPNISLEKEKNSKRASRQRKAFSLAREFTNVEMSNVLFEILGSSIFEIRAEIFQLPTLPRQYNNSKKTDYIKK